MIEEATVSTGGTVYFHPHGTLLPDFKEIIDQFRRSYIVRYQPSNAAAGWHDVRIRIIKSGRYDVKVRKGYTVQSRSIIGSGDNVHPSARTPSDPLRRRQH